jgi:hypothetical protein
VTDTFIFFRVLMLLEIPDADAQALLAIFAGLLEGSTASSLPSLSPPPSTSTPPPPALTRLYENIREEGRRLHWVFARELYNLCITSF